MCEWRITSAAALATAAGRAPGLSGGRLCGDLAMGRRPDDYDMTTDARPEEVMAAFPKTCPTGLSTAR